MYIEVRVQWDIITFNSTKTKLMHFTINNQSPGSIQFMRNTLNVITNVHYLV